MNKGFYWIIVITLIKLLINSKCSAQVEVYYQPPLSDHDRREDFIPYIHQLEDFFPILAEPESLDSYDGSLSNREPWDATERREIGVTETEEIYQLPIQNDNFKSNQPITKTQKKFFDIPLRKSIQVSPLNKNIQTTGYIVSDSSPNFNDRNISPNLIPIPSPNEDSLFKEIRIPSFMNRTTYVSDWVPNDFRIFPSDNIFRNNVISRKQYSEDPVANLVKSKFKFKVTDSPQAYYALQNTSSTVDHSVYSPTLKPTINSKALLPLIEKTKVSTVNKDSIKYSQLISVEHFNNPTFSPITSEKISEFQSERDNKNDVTKVVPDFGNSGDSSYTDDQDNNNQRDQTLTKRISTDIPSSTAAKSSGLRVQDVIDDGVYFTPTFPKREKETKKPILPQENLNSLQNFYDNRNSIQTVSLLNSSQPVKIKSGSHLGKDPDEIYNDVISDVFPFRNNGDVELPIERPEISEIISKSEEENAYASDINVSTEIDTTATTKVSDEVTQNVNPEVKRTNKKLPRKPKIRITSGLVAGILIAAIVFLGFLTGTMVFAFHQWKFGKPMKKPERPLKRLPLFYPEFLDDNFPGNTYIRNNIFLPTPQPTDERDQGQEETDSTVNEDVLGSTAKTRGSDVTTIGDVDDVKSPDDTITKSVLT